MREDYTIAELCEAFELSRSAYYQWSRRESTPRRAQNEILLKEMKRIHEHRHTRCYGSPRMTVELRERGYACSENRVARLMAATAWRQNPGVPSGQRPPSQTAISRPHAPPSRTPPPSPGPEKPSSATSPTWPPGRAGFTSRWSSISSAGRWWVGRSASLCTPACFSTPSSSRASSFVRNGERSSTPIAAANTPAGPSASAWRKAASFKA